MLGLCLLVLTQVLMNFDWRILMCQSRRTSINFYLFIYFCICARVLFWFFMSVSATRVDCGVFVIKFMETWKTGSNLHQEFSQQDIPNIRIKIVNDLLMCEHNKADLDPVRNFNVMVSVILYLCFLVSKHIIIFWYIYIYIYIYAFIYVL